jgi:hypothetical protein
MKKVAATAVTLVAYKKPQKSLVVAGREQISSTKQVLHAEQVLAYADKVKYS